MNWSRIRWLLIVCLLLLNGVLGALLYRQYRAENVVSRAALERTAALLAQSGVTLDVDIVPTAVIKDDVYSISMTEDDYRAALSRMAGSAVSGVYLLPSTTGMSVVFENGDRAEYYHNLYFTYTKSGGNSLGSDWSAMTAAFLSGDTAYVPAAARDSAATAAGETAAAFLTALTESDRGGSSVSLRPKTASVYATPLDTVYLVVLTEEIARGSGSRSAAVIHGTELYVLVEGDCVWYLSGTWVPFLPDGIYETQTLDQVNILFSEMRRHRALKAEASAADTDSADTVPETADDSGTAVDSGGAADAVSGYHTGEVCEIVRMERMHYMLWDNAGNLYLRPAWRFLYRVTEEGSGETFQRTILCDGVTGNVVYTEENPS
ncbi:MAG: hypothetical protein IJ449_13670 [Clostridia bacterium]|nr:hypothetical protein [Clostridia bacterium]